MTKLSIVIPVYKVESCLRTGLDSVVREWRDGVEIIAVNDGSPDNSLSILREYEQKYDFIHVIDQPNAGVSVARNAGIEVANGEWITFMDPDDAYAEGAVEWMLKSVEKTNADIVNFGYKIVHDQKEHVACQTKEPTVYHLDIAEEALNAVKNVFPIAWNCCYKLSAFRQVRYVPGLAKSQDSVYGFSCLCRARAIESSGTVVYAYYQREDSCVHTVSEKRVRGCIDASAYIFEEATHWKWYDVCKKVIFRKVRVTSIGEAVGLIRDFPSEKREELWGFFFDRMSHAFGRQGYVPPISRFLYRISFGLRSPLLVTVTLHYPYKIAQSILKNDLIKALWKKIR